MNHYRNTHLLAKCVHAWMDDRESNNWICKLIASPVTTSLLIMGNFREQLELNGAVLKPECKSCNEWAQFTTTEVWQLALLELLAPNLSSAR